VQCFFFFFVGKNKEELLQRSCSTQLPPQKGEGSAAAELDVVTSPERGGGPLAVVGSSLRRVTAEKNDVQRISELLGLPAGGMRVTAARTDSNPTHGRDLNRTHCRFAGCRMNGGVESVKFTGGANEQTPQSALRAASLLAGEEGPLHHFVVPRSRCGSVTSRV